MFAEALENFSIAPAKRTNCAAKSDIVLSPSIRATKPPELLIVEAISETNVPASEPALTLSRLIPSQLFENFTRAMPKSTICPAKSSISLFPAKSPTIPPEFGSAAAISATSFPASAPALTADSSIPETELENFINAMPNKGNMAAKSSISFSPTIKPTKPPLFGSAAAISASSFAASAAGLTFSTSIPSVLFANAPIALPNIARLAAKPAILLCPPNNEAIPSRMDAPVKIRIVSAKVFAPSNVSEPTFFIPFTKDSAFVIKSDKYVPIWGRPERTPARNPPIKEPKPSPTFRKRAIPLSRASPKPGKRAANPVNNPTTIVAPSTSFPRAANPASILRPFLPTSPRMTHAEENANSIRDREAAISNVGPTFR